MKVVELVAEDGRVVVPRCMLATNPWTRMRGLLGRKSIAQDEGLLIRPTNAIHMMFMRFPIDAVFLDRDLEVLRVVPELQVWKAASQKGAKAVLELPAGAAARAGLAAGTRLAVRG